VHRIMLAAVTAFYLATSSGCLPDAGEGSTQCGDGISQEQFGEECDDGNEYEDDACTVDCKAARCGDGVTRRDLAEAHDDYEECDDNNTVQVDSCRSNCRLARCGDGILRMDRSAGQVGYEECDDGNNDNTDGCPSSCVRDGDLDGDGIADRVDNCRAAANADQADRDNDGAGDVCDPNPDRRNFRIEHQAPASAAGHGANAEQQINGVTGAIPPYEGRGTVFRLKGGVHGR
jgi:cysteine-rich repeat protein